MLGDAARDDAGEPALCDPDDVDLRACYTFDQDLLDGSSYGNDISASNTVLVNGRRGLGLSTASGTFAVASTTSLDVPALTIKLWVKPNTLPIGTARMGLVDSASRWRLFVTSGGGLRCAVTGGIDFTIAGALAAGTWQRVACTYDGSLMHIYVDGTLAGVMMQTSTMPAPGSGMVVGHNNPSGENFDGTIDELQIFSAVVAP